MLHLGSRSQDTSSQTDPLLRLGSGVAPLQTRRRRCWPSRGRSPIRVSRPPRSSSLTKRKTSQESSRCVLDSLLFVCPFFDRFNLTCSLSCAVLWCAVSAQHRDGEHASALLARCRSGKKNRSIQSIPPRLTTCVLLGVQITTKNLSELYERRLRELGVNPDEVPVAVFQEGGTD